MDNAAPSDDEIAAQIRPLLHRAMTPGPRLWGCGFGRPFDDWYELVGFEVDHDVLRLHYKAGETLTVWSLRGLVVDGPKFEIADAKRVRWEWFYPSKPEATLSLYFMEFRHSEEGYFFDTNIDYFDAHLRPDAAEAAVMWSVEELSGDRPAQAPRPVTPAIPKIPPVRTEFVQRVESKPEYVSGFQAAKQELASYNKAGAIRLVRETSGMSLSEAQELVAFWEKSR